MELINYEYYEGKEYKDLNRLEKGILQLMYFDWIFRPTKPGNFCEDLVLIIRLADENKYRLQAQIMDPTKYSKVINMERKSTSDMLKLLDTTFKICTDEVGDDNPIGDFKK